MAWNGGKPSKRKSFRTCERIDSIKKKKKKKKFKNKKENRKKKIQAKVIC